MMAIIVIVFVIALLSAAAPSSSFRADIILPPSSTTMRHHRRPARVLDYDRHRRPRSMTQNPIIIGRGTSESHDEVGGSGEEEEGRPSMPDDDDDDDDYSRVVIASSSSPPPPRRPPPPRSIGVDYGLVRTGIAITSGGYSPRPLAILSTGTGGRGGSATNNNNTNTTNASSTHLSKSIVDLVISEMANEIVVGLPLHKNGTDSEQSSITRSFGMILAMEVRRRCGNGTRVVLYDERYTSKEARSRIVAGAMARNMRIPGREDLIGELDAEAACVILEQYYRDMGWNYAEVVSLIEGSDLANECDAIYANNVESAERMRKERIEERERRTNARREMIDRVRASEEGREDEEHSLGGKEKKKKKKKKK